MIYFIQAGNRIKIGRGNTIERLRIAKTWTPDQPRLLLAIHVTDEVSAEAALHRHFRDQKTSNEWFEINFASAFRALSDLKLIPEASQPILELPVVPPMHPEFRRWYLEFDWRSIDADLPAPNELKNEDIRYVDTNLEDLWHRHHKKFCIDLNSCGSVDKMISNSQIVSDGDGAEFWQKLRELIKKQ
jgi:hypothetical protein